MMINSSTRLLLLATAPAMGVCMNWGLMPNKHIFAAEEPSATWMYDGQLHRVIDEADRVVVRFGGFDCCTSVDDQEVFFEVKDQDELDEFRQRLQFVETQRRDACMCCGYPGIDWYKGTTRIALTSLQHDIAIRWEGFPGDARLTQESSQWIVKWLGRHGVLTSRTPEETIAIRTREKFSQLAPAGFRDILTQAEVEHDSLETPVQERLKDERIRSLFSDEAELYSTLFRLLGLQTMRWDSWYEPEQGTAFDFLTRAPLDELDRAVRSAVSSDDAIEKRGAARMVFSQFFMTSHGKTEDDIRRWMEMLDHVAYADPLAPNRRLVLHRLVEYRVLNLELLNRAVSDPDQTVRRSAMRALVLDASPEATAILRKVANGEAQPRKSTTRVIDYGLGSGDALDLREMGTKQYEDTDEVAANKAIQAIANRHGKASP